MGFNSGFKGLNTTIIPSGTGHRNW